MSPYAYEQGTGDDVIVLVHGFGGTHEVWAPMQSTLAPIARTLAYDLPGHGRSSDFPDAGPPRVAAAAIAADLAARGLDRVHLVGHSMGGAVACIIAMSEPARIASLTLLAPGGFGPEINHRLLTRFAAAADEPSMQGCLEAMFGYLSPVPRDDAGKLLASRQENGNSATLSRIAAGLVRDGRQGQLPRDRLAAFGMPVHVAWGELDNVLPVRHSQGLPANFVVHRFADLGHMLPDEAPDLMTGIVRACMAEAG